jgi:5-methylcytosine-specific restriction endonuclease McrA
MTGRDMLIAFILTVVFMMVGLEINSDILIVATLVCFCIFAFIYFWQKEQRDWRNLREYYAQRQTQKQVFDEEFLEVRTAVLKRDGYRCVNCGQTGTELHVHHIIPRSEGGTNDLSNLVTLCGKCHSIQDAKGHKLIQKRLDEDLSEEHAGLVASNEQEDSEALFW